MDEDIKRDRATTLLMSFWHIQKQMALSIQKTAQQNGLSMPQYTTLLAMVHQKEMMQKRIQQKTKLPKSTLSQAIDGLVQAGFIERRVVEGNRREMQLVVSAKGKELMSSMNTQPDGIHQLFQQVTDSLSDEKFKQMIQIHEQILTELKRGEASC